MVSLSLIHIFSLYTSAAADGHELPASLTEIPETTAAVAPAAEPAAETAPLMTAEDLASDETAAPDSAGADAPKSGFLNIPGWFIKIILGVVLIIGCLLYTSRKTWRLVPCRIYYL